jgi:hypothetical protein
MGLPLLEMALKIASGGAIKRVYYALFQERKIV